MDVPNYGRTVALTQETLAAMSERQLKQKALKEELDRQIMERRAQSSSAGIDTSGMTRAQKKRLELQELRGQQQQAPAHQTHSLPPNHSVSSQAPQSLLPDVYQRGNGFGSPSEGLYESRSLPANLHLAVSKGIPFHPSPLASPVTSHDNFMPPKVDGIMHPNSSAPSAYSAPRQVFSMSDVLGFAKMATSDPPMEDGAPVTNPTNTKAHPASNVKAPPSAVGQPRGGGAPTSPGVANQRAPSSSQSKDRQMQNKVGRLQKELENREIQMQKMMEKNKNWELQAQQLRQQLKEERKKSKVQVPTRAETAPQPPPPQQVPAPKRRLEPIERPSNAMAGISRPKAGITGAVNSPTVAPQSTLIARKDFIGTLVNREEQRPITAPDVLDSTPQLLRSGHLPPLQRPQPSPMVRNKLEATVKNPRMRPVASTNDDISYMGDPEKVRQEEEQAVQMMGSKGPLVFHSRREEEAMEEQSHVFSLDHLQWLVSIQIITAQQGRKLWGFFCECNPENVPVEMHFEDSSAEDEEEAAGYSSTVDIKKHAPAPPAISPRNGHYTRKSSIDRPSVVAEPTDEEYEEEDEYDEDES